MDQEQPAQIGARRIPEVDALNHRPITGLIGLAMIAVVLFMILQR
jgi:hypothetical protein